MNESQQKNTKKSLVIYSIAIFVAAVAIILLASVSQARIAREADAIKGKLQSAETLAASSQTRLDAVMTENTRLTEKVNALAAENGKLVSEKETTEKKLEAEKRLSKMILNHEEKDFNTEEAKKAFEEAGLFEYLSEESKNVYNNIIK